MSLSKQLALISSKEGVKIFGEINPATKRLGPFYVEHWSIKKDSPNSIFSTLVLAEAKKNQIIYDYVIKPREEERKKSKNAKDTKWFNP